MGNFSRADEESLLAEADYQEQRIVEDVKGLTTMAIDTAQPVGRELAAEVAERVMGLVRCRAGGHDPGDWCHAQPDSPAMGSETRCYSTDIAAAMEVEDRIAELGLADTYANHLCRITAAAQTNRLASTFDLIHATPEQRCRAALAAIGPKKVTP